MKHDFLSDLRTLHWSEAVSEADMDGVKVTQANMDVAKRFFEIGHRAGQDAMFDVMKDFYENDPDLLVDLFEDDPFNAEEEED